jgi:hypothetical protein
VQADACHRAAHLQYGLFAAKPSGNLGLSQALLINAGQNF